MRSLYSMAWWLAMPLVMLRLWRRGRKEPGYRQHWGERFGSYAAFERTAGRLIWVHAVSVGETRASEPLVQVLLDADPGNRILLTHMTATGRATGAALFGKHGTRVIQSFLPYDTGWMTSRFLQHYQPILCVLMETEVWPNLIAQCKRSGIPVALVNARLSERSLRKGRRLGRLMQEAAQGITLATAQTKEDAQRLQQLGVADVQVTGSLKFDITPPPSMLSAGKSLRTQYCRSKVLLCASTREGEEVMILDAWLAHRPRNLLLVIVPRHPQRFDEVATQIAARGLAMQRRSTLGMDTLAQETEVLLGDSMGEMFAYYAAADVAFIGGSLLPLGGQNLIEACSVGTPVLVGPHTFNFSKIVDDAVAAKAAIRVETADHLIAKAMHLMENRLGYDEARQAAFNFSQAHRGALRRTISFITPLLTRNRA